MTHYSWVKKGEAGHMHNFFPLHGFTPSCQRSQWNSTKKKHWLNDKTVFFFHLSSCRESQRLQVLVHQPALLWRRPVVSRTHRRRHHPYPLSHSPALILMVWSLRVLEECLRRAEDKKAPGSLSGHRWAACSSFTKLPRSAILHRRKSFFHGRWNLEREPCRGTAC